MPATIHGSAVLVGPRAVLIRGASGSGKSRLAFGLITAAQSALLPFARLVGDDRVFLEAAQGHLLVRPAPQLAGLLEMHGLGIRRLPYESVAAVGLVVDLDAEDGARMPGAATHQVTLAEVTLPRLPVANGTDALPLVLGWAITAPRTT